MYLASPNDAIDAYMWEGKTWTNVYNLIPEHTSTPESLNDIQGTERTEVEELFSDFWKPDSGHTYFPFLIEDVLGSAFKIFKILTRNQATIESHNREDKVPSVIKGLILAIAALQGRFSRRSSADQYFLFSKTIFEQVSQCNTVIDFVFMNTALVCLSLYLYLLI